MQGQLAANHHHRPAAGDPALVEVFPYYTGPLVSVGAAPNKLVAKIASDLDKPDGLVVVPPGREQKFLAPLPIKRLWGVGPRSQEALRSLGIHRVADLQDRSEPTLVARFGTEFGRHLFRLSRGIDDRPVITARERKSISCERTLGTFLAGEDQEAIDRLLLSLCEELGGRLHREDCWGQTLTLKVRDHQFQTITRSRT